MNSQFTILNPCSKRWTDLTGSGRARFCETCQTPVHDFATYSPKEWEKLWKENNGHVCGYVVSSPVQVPRTRRAILMGALFTAASSLFAESGTIRIKVTDAAGTALRDTEVALLGAGGIPVRTLRSNQQGDVVWTDLPVGNNRFRIQQRGFRDLFMTVVAESGNEVQQGAVLDVGFVGEVMTVQRKKRKHWWIFW